MFRNMNQKYQQRYATPVEDFGGLDNKLRMRPALPFTETMEEQGVPLDHSYHVSVSITNLRKLSLL